ncbi:hypothetical protein SKAU_G00027040 [Synaphobranchus kaupii]|uniref:Uncharacterized protein n=1 Tax=Synaphobranchus kaupii TaxID=118154 RepID=A0A9Q1JCS5_SYNKA|nr:hypothetical protein SKAU_G00027040 [Synaphobranchus kaupii]
MVHSCPVESQHSRVLSISHPCPLQSRKTPPSRPRRVREGWTEEEAEEDRAPDEVRMEASVAKVTRLISPFSASSRVERESVGSFQRKASLKAGL